MKSFKYIYLISSLFWISTYSLPIFAYTEMTELDRISFEMMKEDRAIERYPELYKNLFKMEKSIFLHDNYSLHDIEVMARKHLLELSELADDNKININDYEEFRLKLYTTGHLITHEETLAVIQEVYKSHLHYSNYLELRKLGDSHDEAIEALKNSFILNFFFNYKSLRKTHISHKEALEALKSLNQRGLWTYEQLREQQISHKEALDASRIFFDDYLRYKRNIDLHCQKYIDLRKSSFTHAQALELLKEDNLKYYDEIQNLLQSIPDEIKNVLKLAASSSIFLKDYVQFYNQYYQTLAIKDEKEKSRTSHIKALEKARLATIYRSVDKYPFHAIYNSPGINAKALSITADEVSSLWESVSLNEVTQGLSTPLMALVDLNKLAASLWQDILDLCYENIPDINQKVIKLRTDYFNQSLQCGNSQDIIQNKLQLLIDNIKIWSGLDSDIYQSQNYFKNMQGIDFSSLNLPPLHPLVGQIFTELYAKTRLLLAKYNIQYFSHGSTFKSIGDITSSLNLDLSNLKFKCINYINSLKSDEIEACNTIAPQLVAFYKIENLFKSHTQNCQNYGLAPNASLYMFSNINGSLKPNISKAVQNMNETSTHRHKKQYESNICWTDSHQFVEEINSKQYDPSTSYKYYLKYSYLFDFYDKEHSNTELPYKLYSNLFDEITPQNQNKSTEEPPNTQKKRDETQVVPQKPQKESWEFGFM